MTVIPEIVILNVLNAILNAIFIDLNKDIDKEKSLLYFLLSGKNFEGFDYYEQAVDLFSRKNDHTRKIKTNLSFNGSRVVVPTIHVTIPSEQSENNGIGIDSGYVETIIQGHDSRNVFTRMFGARYDLLITSDNSNEVLLIYHVLRAGIIAFIPNFEFSGIRNIKLSGQEIRLDSGVVPGVFIRAIGLTFNYEVSVPDFFTQRIIEAINFKGIPINN